MSITNQSGALEKVQFVLFVLYVKSSIINTHTNSRRQFAYYQSIRGHYCLGRKMANFPFCFLINKNFINIKRKESKYKYTGSGPELN